VQAALYACEKDALLVDAGRGFFRRCMQSKGFSKAD